MAEEFSTTERVSSVELLSTTRTSQVIPGALVPAIDCSVSASCFDRLNVEIRTVTLGRVPERRPSGVVRSFMASPRVDRTWRQWRACGPSHRMALMLRITRRDRAAP